VSENEVTEFLENAAEFSREKFQMATFIDCSDGESIILLRALSINVASPATLPRNGYVNGTAGNVIELVDHIHHTPTQNDVFKICNIKKFRFS
jgi:hypothetical protein